MSYVTRFSPDKSGWATFSKNGLYRYELGRDFPPDLFLKGVVAFLMLNPSVATESALDPTLRRCAGFTKEWGARGFRVYNIFGLISPSPLDLLSTKDPVGPDNDFFLKKLGESGMRVFCGWGADKLVPKRLKQVLPLIGTNLWCLGVNADWSPRHPLYLRTNSQPKPWSPLWSPP